MQNDKSEVGLGGAGGAGASITAIFKLCCPSLGRTGACNTFSEGCVRYEL